MCSAELGATAEALEARWCRRCSGRPRRREGGQAKKLLGSHRRGRSLHPGWVSLPSNKIDFGMRDSNSGLRGIGCRGDSLMRLGWLDYRRCPAGLGAIAALMASVAALVASAGAPMAWCCRRRSGSSGRRVDGLASRVLGSYLGSRAPAPGSGSTLRSKAHIEKRGPNSAPPRI